MAERRVFADDRRRSRRRLLTATVVLAALATAVTFALELLPTPQWLSIVAVATASVALLVAARAMAAMGADDRLRMREAEQTLDLMDSMVVVLDCESRVTFANPAACRAFARPERDLLGQVLQEHVFTPADRTASLAAFADIMAGRLDPTGYESVREVLRPDGTIRVVAWHLALRFDDRGRISSLLVSGEDVTDARARESVRDRERADIDQLRRLAQEVASRDDARQAVVDRIRALLDASFVGLSEPLDDESGDWAYTTTTLDDLPGHRILAGQPSGTRVVARSGAPMLVRDTCADDRLTPALVQRSGARSLLLHPVIERSRVVAVITAGFAERVDRLDDRTEQLMALAAEEAAMALQRIATLRHLERAALTDVLTGAANRRAFDAELERSVARASRSGEPLSLALLDLNAFKQLNDRDGHHAGDDVLAACARSWEGQLRRTDVLSRIGGDEFAVLLPGCDAAAAGVLAERLRAATPHASGAAVGVSTWAGEPPEQLHRRADEALYADNAGGRSCAATGSALS